MSRFHTDDQWQKAIRDAVLGPGFYGRHAADGRYVYLDKGALATKLQKRYAVDTILQRDAGRAVAIEEKIVRWPGYPYDAITLETMSCTVPGRESPGWMKYGQADWLNYVMCQDNGNLLLHLIEFQKLKERFWPAANNFKETITMQANRTACCVVPIDWIEREVGLWQRTIYACPAGAELVRGYNATHYRNGSAASCRAATPTSCSSRWRSSSRTSPKAGAS